MAKKGKVSVIIPTYNRVDVLLDVLAGVTKQLIPGDEILLIDDGTDSDGLKRIKKAINSMTQVRLFEVSHGGPARARNWGIEKARNDILIFINDDTLMVDGFVEAHRSFHQRHSIHEAMVGRAVDHPSTIGSKLMKWLVRSGLHFGYPEGISESETMPWYYLWTCNMSLKAMFLKQYKLRFSLDFPTAAWEDVEFAYRCHQQGLRIYFSNKAKVWHFHKMTFVGVKLRFYGHGRGLRVMEKKMPVEDRPFLVKGVAGKVILNLCRIGAVVTIMKLWEHIVKKQRWYKNWLMHPLVIWWKALGYWYEHKMSRL